MRFDLYTREDRAQEAMSYYLSEEASKYWTWVGWGSHVLATLVTILAMSILPESYTGFEIVPKELFVYFIPIIGQAGLVIDSDSFRLLTIWGIVFGVCFIASRFTIKLVAVFQGFTFGAIFGLIAGGFVAAVCLGLGLPWKALSIGIGCIAALFGLVTGILGVFLPAAR